MRTTRMFALVALVALGLAAPAAVRPAGAALDPKFDPSHLVIPPLGPLPKVQPVRYTLGNGIRVYLLENHDLPLVTGRALFRASNTWVPDDKTGLAGLTGEVMRSGGSAAHSGDWLDDRLGSIGASLQTGISTDNASGTFRCLSENAPELLGLLGEIVRAPVFPQDKIELAKISLRRGIAGRNDEMIPLLIRTARQAVWGKDSKYARTPEYATVDAITRDDCVKLHRMAFEPDRMVLAIYGDFKTSEMKKLIARAFGDWKAQKVTLPAPPPTPAPTPAHVVFAPKNDVTQSGIIVTELGIEARDPDYPALDVLMMALGGGFQSRLFNLIRTERGLAYATGAFTGVDYTHPGVFAAYSLTRSESTMVALDLLKREVTRVTREPLHADELETAKQSTLNSFVFNFARPQDVLFRAAYFDLVGYPQDFLQRYQQGVEAVTAASALGAARRKIHPDSLVSVIVGKESDFDRPLSSLGEPVERVDITIPPPPAKAKVGEATPATLARGQEMLAKAAALAGGSEAWKGIHAVQLSQEGTISLQGQTLPVQTTVSWRLPDRLRAVQKLSIGLVEQGFDGKDGWMAVMGQVRDQPQAGQRVREEYERSLYHLFGDPSSVKVQALDPQTVDGTRYSVAFVHSDVVHDWLLFFDPDGRLARMEYQGLGASGPAHQTELLDDWQAHGGVKLPGHRRVLSDGKPLLESKLVTVTFNPELADSVFSRPAE